METHTISLDEVVYDSNVYPREKWNAATVDTYVDVIKSGQRFPPLILEKDTNLLLDGVHRWKAYLKYQDLYQEHLEQEEEQKRLQKEGKAVVDTPDFWTTPPISVEVEYHHIPEVYALYQQCPDPDTLDKPHRQKFLQKLMAFKKLYATNLSAKHGDRISKADKYTVAREVYEAEPDFTLSTLSQYLSVSLGTAHGYVKDILARRKEEQRMTAFRLHLLGWTEREIAERLNVSPSTAHEICSEFSDLKKQSKKLLQENHPHLDVAERCNMPLILVWAIDLEGRKDSVRFDRLNITIQPYDVWNFGKCHELFGRQHPGRLPGQLIAHLLYFFTKPGDMVVDMSDWDDDTEQHDGIFEKISCHNHVSGTILGV